MKWLFIAILILNGCKEKDMAIEALSYPIEYVDSNIVEETEFYNPLVPNYGTGTYRTELDIYKIESEDIPSNIIDIIGTGSNINQNSKYYNYSFIENGILISHTGVASLGDLNNYALTSYTPNIKGVTLVTLVFSNGISHSNGEYYTYDIQVKVIYQEDGVHQQVLHTSTNNYTIYDGLTNHAGITPELFFDNGELYSFNPIYPKMIVSGDRIGGVSYTKIFDGRDITTASTVGDMIIQGTSTHRFNAITLSNVIGDSVDIIIYDDSNGSFTGTPYELISSENYLIDCYIDKTHIYDREGMTYMFPAFREVVGDTISDNILPKGMDIRITIFSFDEATLGTIESNLAVEIEQADINLSGGQIDYNTYDADEYGQIQDSVKPIVNSGSYTLYGKYNDMQKVLTRIERNTGKFMTFDPTNYYMNATNSTPALVKRGVYSIGSYKTNVAEDTLEEHMSIKVNFREII